MQGNYKNPLKKIGERRYNIFVKIGG